MTGIYKSVVVEWMGKSLKACFKAMPATVEALSMQPKWNEGSDKVLEQFQDCKFGRLGRTRIVGVNGQ